jgi:LPXTG-motif cell wall-anchored protein
VLSLRVTIPAATPPGAHTITISPTADPGRIVAAIGITVGGALPNTGVDPSAGLLGGVLLLLAGAGALVARRLARRRLA